MSGLIWQAGQASVGFLPTAVGVRIHYFFHQKRFPSIRNPTRFSEKIIKRKLKDRNPDMPLLADKLEAKKFVKDTVGSKFVTPTIWQGASLPPLEQRVWQPPYVIKSTHGSGDVLFICSASDIIWPTIEARCDIWLRTRHAKWAGEWLYTQIKPRLFIEPFLGDVGTLPVDYKCFVFDGKVHYIQVDTDRATSHKRTFFSPDWRRQEFSMGYPLDHRDIRRPESLDEMISAAEGLGNGWAFVRVDFYDIGGEPRFGEFTFYPDSGVAVFSPDRYDQVLGKLWPR